MHNVVREQINLHNFTSVSSLKLSAPVNKGGLLIIATPVNANNAVTTGKRPHLSPRNMNAKRVTKTGALVPITIESAMLRYLMPKKTKISEFAPRTACSYK